MIQIYTGDGKGKTTAAVGLAVRCAGSGGRVLFGQFLKDNTSSELRILSGISNIQQIPPVVCRKFYYQMKAEEKENLKKQEENYFRALVSTAEKTRCDMVVLDEALPAVNLKLIALQEMENFLKAQGTKREIVLTGRDAPDSLIELADYVSEICKRKHPYDRGTGARKGIEY
ncbi:MAG: cob(I)yrinic acid a,c-diamide adenosyltransferase [Oscillospiraceae bacterium]|nr:cob(I)yrinic acid a,c-diamide adenosyltransferase [Oscillospiraceae bacterium]MDD3261156.1 cob(I)yrinic acid a,c-diamide adenosyltransferase [Oscillospiraceae bacterium]